MVAVRTWALEEQATACQMILLLAEALQVYIYCVHLANQKKSTLSLNVVSQSRITFDQKQSDEKVLRQPRACFVIIVCVCMCFEFKIQPNNVPANCMMRALGFILYPERPLILICSELEDRTRPVCEERVCFVCFCFVFSGALLAVRGGCGRAAGQTRQHQPSRRRQASIA